MKYKTNKVIEDPTILEGISLRKLAEKLGCNQSYLFRLRVGDAIATEEFYIRLKEARKGL